MGSHRKASSGPFCGPYPASASASATCPFSCQAFCANTDSQRPITLIYHTSALYKLAPTELKTQSPDCRTWLARRKTPATGGEVLFIEGFAPAPALGLLTIARCRAAWRRSSMLLCWSRSSEVIICANTSSQWKTSTRCPRTNGMQNFNLIYSEIHQG